MNNSKDIIRHLLDQSAMILFKASSILTDDEFFAQPEIGASMAWTLMHLASYQDWFISVISSNTQREFTEMFSEAFKGGRPFVDSDMKLYRTKRETVEVFVSTQAKLLNELDKFDLARWDEPAPRETPFPTLGSIWENILSENFWHLGQLSVSVPRLAFITIPVPRVY